MGWLNKIFKGSVNRVSRVNYDGNWHESNSPDHSKGAYDESDNEDMDRAIALSLAEGDPNKGKAAIDAAPDYSLEEDEQLARALQESLNTESPPHQHVPVANVPSESIPTREPPQPIFPSSGYRTCAGCKNPIGHGRFLSCMDAVWHPQCFRCFACNKPISEYEFAMHEDQPYHKSCYKDFFHPKCDVCKNFIPTNRNGLIEYRAHPFWMQKYCPSHEDDGTPRCCSCERMEGAKSSMTRDGSSTHERLAAGGGNGRGGEAGKAHDGSAAKVGPASHARGAGRGNWVKPWNLVRAVDRDGMEVVDALVMVLRLRRHVGPCFSWT